MTPFLIPTAEPNVYELHVDNSAKELFETCARAAEYYTVRRRQLAGEGAALFFGGTIHKALVPRKMFIRGFFEQWKLAEIRRRETIIGRGPQTIPIGFGPGVPWPQCQEAIIVEEFMAHPTGPEEWRTADRAIDVIQQYNQAYPWDKEPFKPLPNCCEMAFKILLGEAELQCNITDHRGTYYVEKVVIYWTGRMDDIVDYGSLLVQDHKTTSVLGPTFYDDFILSSQMQGYTWAARKLGHNVAGLLLDVLALRKPTRTGTATEFQRQRYFYSDEHIAEWERDTFTLITDFLEHLCRGYFPKSPKWCHGKYGKCQYWGVCTDTPDKRSERLMSSQFNDVTWSPLV